METNNNIRSIDNIYTKIRSEFYQFITTICLNAPYISSQYLVILFIDIMNIAYDNNIINLKYCNKQKHTIFPTTIIQSIQIYEGQIISHKQIEIINIAIKNDHNNYLDYLQSVLEFIINIRIYGISDLLEHYIDTNPAKRLCSDFDINNIVENYFNIAVKPEFSFTQQSNDCRNYYIDWDNNLCEYFIEHYKSKQYGKIIKSIYTNGENIYVTRDAANQIIKDGYCGDIIWENI